MAGRNKDSGASKQAVLLYGDDEFNASAAARKLVDRLCPPDQQALGLEIIDGAVQTVDQAVDALKRCIGSIQTLGFFSGEKVTWFKGAVCLGDDSVISASKEVKELAEVLAQEVERGLAPGQKLVISAGKVDGRTTFFKTMSSHAELRSFTSGKNPREQEAYAQDAARKFFADAGAEIDSTAFASFFERVGTDTRMLYQEACKLMTYAGGRKISAADVSAITTVTRDKVGWDLQDAVGERKLSRALTVLRRLLYQKESPIGLLMSIQGRVRDLVVLRTCLDKGWASVQRGRPNWSGSTEADQVLGAFQPDPRKMHPFRAGRLLEQAQGFSLIQLVRFHELTVKTHEQLIGDSRFSHDLLLEILLLRALPPPLRAARR